MEEQNTLEQPCEGTHEDGPPAHQDEAHGPETLEEFFAGVPPADNRAGVSRRRFLTGAVVGGAAGLAVAAGTGAVVWKVKDGEVAELEAANAELRSDLQSVKEGADLDLGALAEDAAEEIARLLGLLDLYEELDKIGLDGIIEKGLAAMALPLGALEAGARVLKSGLEWAENALQTVAEAMPTAQEALVWLETQVSALANAIETLENGVARALDKATDNAVGEAVKDFATKILDALPFSLGDRFRDALAGLVALVTSVDDFVEGINTKLLEPLRQNWFPAEDGEGVRGTFFDPLVTRIFDPLEEHLDNLATLADTWQIELATPTQQAMAERARLRAEIDRYRKEYQLA
jgi:chromosome segregation ATPase